MIFEHKFLVKHRFVEEQHAPYALDLAPYNFFLLLTTKLK